MNDFSNDDKLRELLHLDMFNALSHEEKQTLERALESSDSLRQEAAELKRLFERLDAQPDIEPPQALLIDARAELRARLRLEQSRTSFSERVVSMLERLSTGEGNLSAFQFALGAVLLFLMGGLAGYGVFFFSFAASQNELVANSALNDLSQVANIRFIEPSASDSTIEVSFDVVTPAAVNGTLSDKRVKSLLIRALGSGENPGLRLQALNILQQSPSATLDGDIQAALIRAAKFDANAGVRKTALLMLLQCKRTSDIQLALIHILMNDNNAGIRISAMNALAGGFGVSVDNTLLGDLRKRLESDDNKYIRVRAGALIDELEQPKSQN